MGQQGRNVLLNGDTDVAPSLFDSHAIAKTPRQARAIGEIPFVFWLFLDYHLKVVKLHGSPSWFASHAGGSDF